MCGGYKTNKYGYNYCNHGFPLMTGCKLKGEVKGTFVPSCVREESHMSVLPEGFDIIKYREKMESYKSTIEGIK